LLKLSKEATDTALLKFKLRLFSAGYNYSHQQSTNVPTRDFRGI